MNRKLQQSGALYFISTPTEWIKDNKLQKGDELNLTIDGQKLIINPNKLNIKKYKKTTLTINKADPKTMINIITSLFVAGFNEFELIFNQELDNNSFAELKRLINELGLSMLDLSRNNVKINVNVEISDIKKFSKELIYQAINFTRMVISKEKKSFLSEQLVHFYYQRYVLMRTVYRYQQSLIELDIKPYEALFCQKLGVSINNLVYHLIEVKNFNFIENIKKILEKLITVYEKPNIESLTEINKLIESNRIESKKIMNNNDYRIRSVYRSLKGIIRDLTEVYFISQ